MAVAENHMTWVGVHLFLLPCIERIAMARAWLMENPPDVGAFKKQFPDARSNCGLLLDANRLHGTQCVENCPLHETCELAEARAHPVIHPLENSKPALS
ncbi:hypothetical protein RCH09_003129 [Actimicrobium sp. GrIS 1.19]|uniref:hypothetical protein n=1 Tax=Actimicrobium sp. GrIS 1.19 TaxID=3071708 RepID=UPI002E06AF70|nr:hypothetical protein [Actimicrobium sp. GrIS 1.19]